MWQMYEWESDGPLATETISWIVMEQGHFLLNEGTRIEANTQNVNGNWVKITFIEAFKVLPIIITQPLSINNNRIYVIRTQNMTR